MVAITVKPVKRLGLQYWGVFAGESLLATFMSESGARSKALALKNKLAA